MRIFKIVLLTSFTTGAALMALLFMVSPGQLMEISLLHSAFHSSPDQNSYDLVINDYKVESLERQDALENHYRATVNISNNGADLLRKTVYLAVDPHNHSLVLTKDDGTFSLLHNESHTVSYDFSLPKYLAQQKLNLKVKPYSFTDNNEQNNSVELMVKQDQSGINNFTIDQLEIIKDQGKAKMHFTWQQDQKLDGLDYSLLYTIKKTSIDGLGDLKYREANNNSREYYVGDFSNKFLEDNDFIATKIDEEGNFLLPLDLTLNEDYVAIVLMADDNENQSQIYSNPVYLAPAVSMSKAEFSRYLIDKLYLKSNPNTLVFFDDVSSKDWSYSYVQTLYSNGILPDESRFEPGKLLTRREALRILNLAFDVALSAPEKNFTDVTEGDYDYYQINIAKKLPALKNKEVFSPEEMASKAFLDYVFSQKSLLTAN